MEKAEKNPKKKNNKKFITYKTIKFAFFLLLITLEIFLEISSREVLIIFIYFYLYHKQTRYLHTHTHTNGL